MKTNELSLAIRKFVLSGELPAWLNEDYFYINLHTAEPLSASDHLPQYNGYKPVKVARSSVNHGAESSEILSDVQFPANRDKGITVDLRYYSISIGQNFMAYKNEIPDGGISLTSGHAPYFESGSLRILEK